ncbi:hypothetical protein DPX16_21293 [Anabarilius grahami]|uniref:Uncharacterized protein n=1 Tax=Anabarilius grahami TaxID=495550 RepID=A0A3N0XZR8_ANAGA|nr:hypothetical protein DPX16_21293 [Anabarilius grahami]
MINFLKTAPKTQERTLRNRGALLRIAMYTTGETKVFKSIIRGISHVTNLSPSNICWKSSTQELQVQTSRSCIVGGSCEAFSSESSEKKEGPMDKPFFSTCCRSLIGCKECIDEWTSSHTYCPKCRADDLEDCIHEVTGLTEALATLEKLFL